MCLFHYSYGLIAYPSVKTLSLNIPLLTFNLHKLTEIAGFG